MVLRLAAVFNCRTAGKSLSVHAGHVCTVVSNSKKSVIYTDQINGDNRFVVAPAVAAVSFRF